MKSQLAASFDRKDLGDLHYFLGIEVIRTPKGILINQYHYALSMLFKFGMADYKSISTPLEKNVKLHQDCQKPNLFDDHSSGSQLPGWHD